jgi:hypothetical protein
MKLNGLTILKNRIDEVLLTPSWCSNDDCVDRCLRLTRLINPKQAADKR